jgi:hypothetical protein
MVRGDGELLSPRDSSPASASRSHSSTAVHYTSHFSIGIKLHTRCFPLASRPLSLRRSLTLCPTTSQAWRLAVPRVCAAAVNVTQDMGVGLFAMSHGSYGRQTRSKENVHSAADVVRLAVPDALFTVILFVACVLIVRSIMRTFCQFSCELRV